MKTAATTTKTTVETSLGNDTNDKKVSKPEGQKEEAEREQDVPDVRPIKYGSASPPDIGRNVDFNGRGGVWHCENCDKPKLLPSGTKQWKCPKCKKIMYTLPPDECPLDTFCPCCCWDAILTRN